jgi:hypothetical protein
MPFIKHVGQTVDTNKKCIVVFRSIPNEEGSCLIVETEALPANYHDKLIESVESSTAQSEMDFYTFAQREVFHDGNNMLQAMHKFGWLKKKQVDQVEMMPTPGVVINLRELNQQINDIKAKADQSQQEKTAGVLSDKDLANQMRSQSAFYAKEAQRLSEEAIKLDPQSIVPPIVRKAVMPVQNVDATDAKRGRGRPKKK